eukprot:1178932-Prorocentrum_minimum.AAC.1
MQGLLERARVAPFEESRHLIRDRQIEEKQAALGELERLRLSAAARSEEEAEAEGEDPALRPLSAEEEAAVDEALGPGPQGEVLASSEFTSMRPDCPTPPL